MIFDGKGMECRNFGLVVIIAWSRDVLRYFPLGRGAFLLSAQLLVVKTCQWKALEPKLLQHGRLLTNFPAIPNILADKHIASQQIFQRFESILLSKLLSILSCFATFKGLQRFSGHKMFQNCSDCWDFHRHVRDFSVICPLRFLLYCIIFKPCRFQFIPCQMYRFKTIPFQKRFPFMPPLTVLWTSGRS